jgi:radical SAM protein with 4Fe4S-binding SPASM domain
MNMDLYNAKDLLQLVDELANRFGGRKGIAVYAHHIFKEGVALTEQYADEEWKARDAAMIRLEERIQQSGLAAKQGLHRVLKLNHCMADSGHAVTILPDGNVGLCEHYSESEFAGHIDRKGFDTAVVESWKEMLPEIPECAECFYYPACLRLKKCPNSGGCYPLYRQEQNRKVKRAMISHYENLKNKIEVEEEENAGNC